MVELGEGTILLQGGCPVEGQEMGVKESNFLGEEVRFRGISGLKTHSTSWLCTCFYSKSQNLIPYSQMP